MSFTSNKKVTGKKFTSEQGVSIAGLVQNGVFKFRDKLSKGQTYRLDVLTQPRSQICYISHGQPRAVTSDVSNIRVHCKIGEALLSSFPTPTLVCSQCLSTVPKDKKLVAAQEKKDSALHVALAKQLKDAAQCYDSELLNPLPTGLLPTARNQLMGKSPLPCTESASLDDIQNNQIADRIYATEIRGRKCIRAHIFANNYVASCFVPTQDWFDAGNDIRPLMRNDDKGKGRGCFCEGEKACSMQRSGLLANTTYMLIVHGYGEADENHANTVHYHVYIDDCTMPFAAQLTLGVCSPVFFNSSLVDHRAACFA
jgi:hypothetical protein